MASEETPLLVDEERDEEQDFFARRAGLSNVEKLALGTALAFFLLSAVAFGLYASDEAKLSQRPATRETVTVTRSISLPAPTAPPKKSDDVCLTSACVRVAADVLSDLDESIDPCDDFYSFAAGGWLKNHPVPEDKGLFGTAQLIDQRNQRTLHAILDAKPDSSRSEDDQVNLKHLRALYDSCLDEDSLDRAGIQPLLDLVKPAVDLWRDRHADVKIAPPWLPPIVPLPPPERGDGPDSDRKARLTNLLLYLHTRGVPFLFSTYLEGDVGQDPEIQRIWTKQEELGLPTPAYYEDKATVEVYEEVVRASIEEVMRGLHKSLCAKQPRNAICAASYQKTAHEVVELEQQLAQILDDDPEDPLGSYNPHNASQLNELFPLLDWRDYFAGFIPKPNLPDPVIVATPSYFKKLVKVLDDTKDSTLAAYVIWRTAKAYGRQLGPSINVRKEVTWLDNFITGVDEGVKESRGDVCLRQVIESAGWLMGRYYVERAFSDQTKHYAESIIAAVISAFGERLPELDWLDEETRKVAAEKAKAIKQKIGFPLTPNTTDASALRRYYVDQEPFDRDDLFGNVLRARSAVVWRTWRRVGAKRDRGIWDMTPDEVNAEYNPAANDITFTAGELQPPYLDPDWPEYLAFGAFGSMGAGHELTHAFDPVGAQYDKDGKLYNWWTNDTAARFKERQECVVKQYGEYYILDRSGNKVYVQSRLTLGEDLADAGGLAQAYRAWQTRYQEGGHPNFLLPGLPYTREQLFFIAQGRFWARNIKPQEAVRRIRTDVHSPTKYRVIGPLSNMPEFAKAFNCKVGDRMVREDRCQVW